MGHHSPSSHRKHSISPSWMVGRAFFPLGAAGSSAGKDCLVGVKTLAFGLSVDCSEDVDLELARELAREVVDVLIFGVFAGVSVVQGRNQEAAGLGVLMLDARELTDNTVSLLRL